MIILIILWIFTGLVFVLTGAGAFRLLEKTGISESGTWNVFDSFFLGFLVISVFAGYLSLLMPLGLTVLIITAVISFILLLFNIGYIRSSINEFVKEFRSLSWFGIFLLSFILLFLIAYTAQQITWGDTESYHAQAIQWIRKYPVIPGLGNIHGRFAFNSMFFVVSGIFTFQIRDILIFPINGICYSFLLMKLCLLVSKELRQGEKWKTVLYGLMGLISFLILLPSLNSPSADTICAILLIYLFTILIDRYDSSGSYNNLMTFLATILAISCVSFKMSSVLSVLILFLVLKKDPIKRISFIIISGVIIISPFLIRNFFLSGYLIYPFPDLDFFNVDWKIPYQNVLSMKQEIEGFAKISSLPYPDVIAMKLNEWIIPWLKSAGFNDLIILSGNALSVLVIIFMLIKRDYFLLKIQLIIMLNIFFWLNMAPDLRFAYGFLITGFALNLAYFVKIFEYSIFKPVLKLTGLGLLLILVLVLKTRMNQPLASLKDPQRWYEPAPFGKVETEVFKTNFEYRVPVQRGGCLNTEIPCVPFPFDNVIMRTGNIRDGFKVDTAYYPTIHYID